MFSPVVAFLMLSYTVMVYVLSCRGFLDVIVHRDGVCSLLCRGFLSCMFSPVEVMLSYTGLVMVSLVCFSLLVEAFLLLSYTVMVYVLSCRGFLDVITGMVYTVILHSDGVCSIL